MPDIFYKVGDRVQLNEVFGAYWPPLPAGHGGAIVHINLDWDLPYLIKLDGAGYWLFSRSEFQTEQT